MAADVGPETERLIMLGATRLPDLADGVEDPFTGIGKPEPLKHILTGAWSRRIDEANCLVYYVTEDHIVILQARDPY